MSRKRFKKHAEKREGVGFLPFPHVALRSDEFTALSPRANKLLLDLLAQYRGDNNGDLCAAFSLMKGRGWRAKGCLSRALAELTGSGFVIETRKGGRHRAALYGVSFFEIDACGGKLDIQAPTRQFMGAWHRGAVVANAEQHASVLHTPTARQTSEARNFAAPPWGN